MREKVLVLGGNFGGLTAALSVKHALNGDVGVTGAAVPVPWTTAIPVGVPKTGFPTEVQARVAADNIAARIRGEEQARHKDFGDPRDLRHGRRQQRRHDPEEAT